MELNNVILPVTAERVKNVFRTIDIELVELPENPQWLVMLIDDIPVRIDCAQAQVLLTVSTQLPNHPIPEGREDNVLAWLTYANETADFAQISFADYGAEHGKVLSIDIPVFVARGATDDQLKAWLFPTVGVIRAMATQYREAFFPQQDTEQ
ncbi:hypothetical protein ACFPVT_04160 [Corynebacterium choanae]|uniref:YbjN domain-containing protein n=1 Tax=Corynebacterium choanae TaxID=1862358 RepID=A0A3G6J8S5_9CORY|nr:hypothetical protein [Corynebacterium choanae]AZA14386.1 hypothetical protein CCHOA_10015 [Corynebacterium choanae]